MAFSNGDKSLHITFNDMGHGDNILISLPNGRTVIIDCGSMIWDKTSYEGTHHQQKIVDRLVGNIISDERFFLNNKILDLLILTHSDEDHCNRLGFLETEIEIFDPNEGIKRWNKAITEIKTIVYGDDLSQYNYTDFIWKKRKKNKTYSVKINDKECKYGEVVDYEDNIFYWKDIEYSDRKLTEQKLFTKSNEENTKGFIKILDGTAVSGVYCAVYLLAGNVETIYPNLQDSSPDNRLSIVTMIVYGDKKFLFMGDSTFNTEYFLYKKYSNLIKDVELIQIPHHGSFTTSSAYPNHPKSNNNFDFVTHVNPCYAVVSAAYQCTKHSLPRAEILEQYQKCSRLKNKPTDSREIDFRIACYKPETENGDTLIQPYDLKGVKQQLWSTGSQGPIDFDYAETVGKKVVRVVQKKEL